jgi:hypothetical protein
MYCSAYRSRKSAGRKPATSYGKTVIGKSANARNGAEAIKSLTTKSHYRGDLSRFAVARFHALNRSLKVTHLYHITIILCVYYWCPFINGTVAVGVVTC